MIDQKSCDIVKNAICASIDNQEWMNRNNKKSNARMYKIKYILWYLLLTLMSPRKKVTSKKFVGTMTPVNEKRLKPFSDNAEYYMFAKLNSSIKQIRTNRSVLSPYSFKERISILIAAVKFYIDNYSELKGYLHFTFEYYSIAYWMIDFMPDVIITPGMYDRYCTFMSYLGYQMSIKLIGVQDGAAIDISVPRKIYVDEMYAFDDFEVNIIKSFVNNDSCKFITTGFTSTIDWKVFPKKKNKIVAIASQDWFTQKTIELIDAVMSKNGSTNYTFILYPHYRENAQLFENIQSKYPHLIISQRDRHKNIDVLITFYSTIVYDFWSVNEKLPIMCWHIQGYDPGYYKRENVHVFDDVHALAECLCRGEDVVCR